MTKKFFITGTDTDIGKTTVTAGIASLGIENGLATAVVKPVQTGTAAYNSDICEIRRLVPGIMDIPADMATPCSFALPASPHLAAAQEREEIDIKTLTDAVSAVELNYSPDLLLIEGAGGILVPLTEDTTFLNLMKLLKIPVIIVASVKLGTINHTLMTVKVLKYAGIEIAGIVFNRMPAESGLVENDNIQIIEKISGVPVLAVIKEIKEDASFAETLTAVFKSEEHLKNLLWT